LLRRAVTVPAYQADPRIASPLVSSLLVILLVIAAGAALVAQLVWWLSGRPEQGRVPPPLVVPIHPQFARTPQVAAAAPVAAPIAAPVAVGAADAPITQTAMDASSAETVQFVRPTDEALQLLPARLEVVSGMTPHQVIRFVRIPGKPAEMILGRETASSPQQVTLTSSTVSRRHARVIFAEGQWLVSNLSRTNPVVVNDQAINEFEGARQLLDGDRIELGDVVLRFCTS
jgi:hypothetical protein